MIGFVLCLVVVGGLAIAPRLKERSRRPVTSALRKEAPGQIANLPNGKTYFEWHGPVDGPVAVCVHGVSTPSYVFNGFIERLAGMGFRVLSFDLYGRGLSARPSGPQSCSFFTAQLDALLDHQGVEEIDLLVGYSMGGAIATRYTSESIDRVERLMIIASAGLGMKLDRYMEFVIKTPVIGDWLMTVRGVRFCRSVRPNMQSAVAEHRYRGTLKSVLSSYRWALSDDMIEDHRALGDAHVPVLAVWAEHEDAVADTSAGRLAEVNRNAFQDVIKGSDHAVVATHPDEVIERLRDFLRDT